MEETQGLDNTRTQHANYTSAPAKRAVGVAGEEPAGEGANQLIPTAPVLSATDTVVTSGHSHYRVGVALREGYPVRSAPGYRIRGTEPSE